MIKEKLLILKAMLNKKFRDDIKSLQIARKGYTYYAYDLCKKIGISEMLESGASISKMMVEKKINNTIMLEALLDFLVGESILTFNDGKYVRTDKIPENFNANEIKFISDNYNTSQEWTFALLEHAESAIKSNIRIENTGFESSKFSQLWDGVMTGPLYSARNVALEEVARFSKKNSKILDLGCGSGTFAIDFALRQNNFSKIIGLDESEKMLEIARVRTKEMGVENKIKFVKKDLNRNFQMEEKFDIAFSSLLINHIPTEKREDFFDRVNKSLKDDGKFIIFQLTNKSKHQRIFSDWLLFVTPTHEGFPFIDELSQQLKRYFSNIEVLLNGSIIIAHKFRK